MSNLTLIIIRRWGNFIFVPEMKRITPAILLIMMVLQVFYQYTIMASFYANQSAIAAALCENTDKPQLKCEGKCFLKKQLKKADKQEKQQQAANAKFEIQLFTATEFSDLYEPAFRIMDLRTGYKNNPYRFQQIASFFHPPQS